MDVFFRNKKKINRYTQTNYLIQTKYSVLKLWGNISSGVQFTPLFDMACVFFNLRVGVPIFHI